MVKKVLNAFGQITEQVEKENAAINDRIETCKETIEKNYNS